MGVAEYIIENNSLTLTDEAKRCFSEDGCIIVRGLLSEAELQQVEKAVENPELLKHQYGRPDKNGKEPKLVLWQHPGNDVTGIVARSEKVAKTCQEILKGSQKCGRIDHLIVGEQTGADTDRVKEIEKVCDLIHVELKAGDAVFFHCNVLHTSSDNTSENMRRALVIAYNKASNDPGPHEKHPGYTPLDVVENSAIMNCENYSDFTGKDFWLKQPQV